MDFPERLVAVRKAQKITQKQAAAAAGVSEAMYQFYEYGRNEPSASVLLALADYFGVSLDYLTGRTDNPEINR